jgi:hypothetical protein
MFGQRYAFSVYFTSKDPRRFHGSPHAAPTTT